MNVIFTVASMAGGGAERVISILANRLSEKGIKVTIIMTAGDTVSYQLNSRVKLLSAGGTSGGSMAKRLKRIRKMRAVLKANQKSVIISFGLGSCFFTSLANAGLHNKFIISERNDPAACPHPKLRNMVYSQADQLVFQTGDAVKCFPEKIQKRGIVIPNPISEDIEPAYIGERKKKIVAVGRLEPQKNYFLLLHAFLLFHQKFPDYTMHLYGEGYLRKDLQEFIEKKKIDHVVTFEGFHPNVHQEIKDAAIYVLSSDYEGISNALLESMALGLPVISTDCPIGGSRLCIQNGVNGLLVPVGDEKAMAQAMIYLASNPQEAEKLGQEAVRVRERFSELSILSQWESLIQ